MNLTVKYENMQISCWEIALSFACVVDMNHGSRIADVGEERGADLEASLLHTMGIHRVIGSQMRHW